MHSESPRGPRIACANLGTLVSTSRWLHAPAAAEAADGDGCMHASIPPSPYLPLSPPPVPLPSPRLDRDRGCADCPLLAAAHGMVGRPAAPASRRRQAPFAGLARTRRTRNTRPYCVREPFTCRCTPYTTQTLPALPCESRLRPHTSSVLLRRPRTRNNCTRRRAVQDLVREPLRARACLCTPYNTDHLHPISASAYLHWSLGIPCFTWPVVRI